MDDSNNKREGVLCFLKRDNKVLLAKFDYGDDGLIWNGVSGFVEQGETNLAAAIREIKEEIGIEVKEGDLDFRGVIDISSTLKLNVYILKKWLGEPTPLDHTIKEFCWYEIDKLPYEKMMPGNFEWLPKLLG